MSRHMPRQPRGSGTPPRLLACCLADGTEPRPHVECHHAPSVFVSAQACWPHTSTSPLSSNTSTPSRFVSSSSSQFGSGVEPRWGCCRLLHGPCFPLSFLFFLDKRKKRGQDRKGPAPLPAPRIAPAGLFLALPFPICTRVLPRRRTLPLPPPSSVPIRTGVAFTSPRTYHHNTMDMEQGTFHTPWLFLYCILCVRRYASVL